MIRPLVLSDDGCEQEEERKQRVKGVHGEEDDRWQGMKNVRRPSDREGESGQDKPTQRPPK